MCEASPLSSWRCGWTSRQSGESPYWGHLVSGTSGTVGYCEALPRCSSLGSPLAPGHCCCSYRSLGGSLAPGSVRSWRSCASPFGLSLAYRRWCYRFSAGTMLGRRRRLASSCSCEEVSDAKCHGACRKPQLSYFSFAHFRR